MPAPYNLTGLQDVVYPTDLIVVANDATNQIFVGGFLMAFYFVLIMILMVKNSFEEATLSASFVFFILSLFLRQMGVLNFVFPIGFLIVTAFVGMYLYMNK